MIKRTAMKELNVKRVSMEGVPAAAVPALLDEEKVTFQPIDTINWESYPYRPRVLFRIAHSGDAIILHFKVSEASVRAVAAQDGGPVWEDSCVEFFSSPAEDGIYYNLECNCTGTLLLAARYSRTDKTDAPKQILDGIQRWASLGREPFEERAGECNWEVALVIPRSTFFRHNPETLSGLDMRANFYKCGDKLQKPHYLSWNAIVADKPDFHRPEYFGMLHFE